LQETKLFYFWPRFAPAKKGKIYLFFYYFLKIYFVYNTDAAAAAAETVEILLHAVKK
jgi:hypothetical protein